ncbi:movement protein [Pear chlorotic leaf spot-associated virus]|uniref:Movement protein n=1 Tax=Pear chlorotic leaf spot-associated virus TaxID=2603627 RepID=A0A7D0MXW2_9VIRU|nr:movement protein [Pear chlorotic leaf spot-associated virus]QEE82895.1 movement protein [Pear chlorotic leaf spot-associated virus]
MLFSFLLLSLVSMMATTVRSAEHDVSLWDDESHLSDSLNTVTIDEMSMTKLKKNFDIKNADQTMKVNFYNLWTATKRKSTNPGKLVRITSMVLCWIPQANNLAGKVTLMLVDNRKEKTDGARIESQVTFKPDRPVIGIFYHNYAMSIDDLKYMDLEFISHGINMVQGRVGRLSFGYKTVITGSTYYNKKNAEVFYLPVEDLPELSVEDSSDIYKKFVLKMKSKKQKEIEYFQKMKLYIDMSRTPVNELTTSSANVLDSLNRDMQILLKYEEDAKKYKISNDQVKELQAAIADTKNRIEVYKNGESEPDQPESKFAFLNNPI